MEHTDGLRLLRFTKYEEPTEGAPIPHTRYVINCNESITLRTNPDVNAAEICQIPLGTAVATFGDAGNGFIQTEEVHIDDIVHVNEVTHLGTVCIA